MFSKFNEEQFGRETITLEDKGFITFKVYDDKSIYIHILWVDPKYRGDNIGSDTCIHDKPGNGVCAFNADAYRGCRIQQHGSNFL